LTLVQKHTQLPQVMMTRCRFIESRSPARNAYTLIELLAGIFIVAMATAVYIAAVRAKHGQVLAVMASALAGLAAFGLVCLFYRWSWRRNRQSLTRLREQYRSIYQIKELPTAAKSIVKPDRAEIKIGDFGWEARPNRRDGLIHLQGLTPEWQVVWHAGFRPDQIEKVAEKPASQYDYWRPPYWDSPPYKAKTKPSPPCPYPVQERNTPTMGLPHHSIRYFRDYPSQYYCAQKNEAAK
jgi:membrane protein implicated in regulation of membrane protease activity